MTGDQAAPRLRKQRPDLPIILSSGYSEAEAIWRFESNGVTAFLQKPYTARSLAEKIATVLTQGT
jgi:CheY-like chemotaxis protein